VRQICITKPKSTQRISKLNYSQITKLNYSQIS